MATRQTRPQRAQRSAPAPHDDSDSGNETEPETPRPTKSTTGLRRRISEVQDKSYEDGPRPPLKTVNINDDAAEKRRRRKSTKITAIENAEAGPSGAAGAGDAEGVAAAANTSRTTMGGRKSNAVALLETPVINVPTDVMTSNFEEWMKMAMDNVCSFYFLTSRFFEALATDNIAQIVVENQCSQLLELCSYRLLSRHVAFA